MSPGIRSDQGRIRDQFNLDSKFLAGFQDLPHYTRATGMSSSAGRGLSTFTRNLVRFYTPA